MAIKKYKPYTASMRFTQTNAHSEVTTDKPEKSLTVGLRKTGGRNSYGRTTHWTKAGGHKRKYRIIDFKRHEKAGIPAKVASIEYDPNRSAHIALLNYADGEKRYILAPLGLKVGQTVEAGKNAGLSVGNALPMNNMPVGTIIHAIELKVGKGAQVCRGAGTGAQIVGKDEKYVMLRLPSSEMRYFPVEGMATVGQVGNLDHNKIKVGKAGRSRWMGKRPSVRGMAMNPVDHPHGGGEGRGKGNHPQTPWGKPTKGYKTRKRRKNSNRLIVRRKNRQVLR